VDFRLAQNRGGSPAWASMVEVKEENIQRVQNIEKIILKLEIYCLGLIRPK